MHKAWKPARGNGNRTPVLQIDGQAVLRTLRLHDSIARMYDTAPISVLLHSVSGSAISSQAHFAPVS